MHGYPCNWSAWLALAALAAPGQELASSEADTAMPRHWTRDFHLVHICLETQENDEALGRLQVRRGCITCFAQSGTRMFSMSACLDLRVAWLSEMPCSTLTLIGRAGIYI